MKKHPKHSRPGSGARRRAGKVVVLVAVMLPTVLIPLLAIGVDGGMLSNDRRRLQAAVDAAALSAVAELYRDNPNHSRNLVQPTATADAQTVALSSLTLHQITEANCESRTVTIPASTSNPRVDGRPGTVEVEVTYLQPRGFSRIWAFDDLPVTARAVARVRTFSQGNGILILEEADDQSLYGHGEGKLIVNQGGVVVNSTGTIAAETTGSSTVLAATSFDVTGDYTGDGFYNVPYPDAGTAEPYTGSLPVPDPLADLPEPNPANYPVRNAPPNAGPADTVIVLQPGRYTSRLFYSGTRKVVLMPGLYYLDKGLELVGDVQLIGSEVMLYNAGSGANKNFELGGTGKWSLTPPTSGTYAGISMFQSRTTADETTVSKLRGNGGTGVVGTIYMPTTQVLITGAGTQTLGSQFIARTLEMSGSGIFTVDYAAAKAPQDPVFELVE